MTLQWLGRSINGVSSWRPGFVPSSVFVGFMMGGSVNGANFRVSAAVISCHCLSAIASCCSYFQLSPTICKFSDNTRFLWSRFGSLDERWGTLSARVFRLHSVLIKVTIRVFDDTSK